MGISFRKQVPLKQIAAFTSHLGEFIRAGIPLLKALELIEKEITHPYFQSVLRDLVTRVRKGESFSQALKRYPLVFRDVYASLIQAGEAGGKLEFSLDRLTESLEKEMELRSKVAQALAYPAFVLAFGVFTVFFLMIVIVPKISAIYTEFGGKFPWITVVVLGVSQWFLQFGWILVLGLIAAGFYLGLSREHPRVKRVLDANVLNIPWMGEMVRQSEIARFGRTLGILLESGVSLLTSIELATGTVLNDKIRARLKGIDKVVSQGKNFSEALRGKRIFPESFLNLIWVGESTGHLDRSLQKVGQIAEKEVDGRIKLMTTLLEPMIILVVGLVIGVIVVSLLLPIFEMSLLVG